MALLSKSIDVVKAMSPEQRTMYFEHYAAYMPDAPTLKYRIRVGSKTLFSDDTLALRNMFDSLLSGGLDRNL